MRVTGEEFNRLSLDEIADRLVDDEIDARFVELEERERDEEAFAGFLALCRGGE